MIIENSGLINLRSLFIARWPIVDTFKKQGNLVFLLIN